MSFVPNTTPTPNWLYNGEMKKMNETELKVVLLVTRKTLGWFDPLTGDRKNQDYISQSQFMEFTGQSHTAIAQAIQSCVERGWIIVKDKNGELCDTSEKRRRRKNWYQLGCVFTDKISKQQSGQEENLSNKTTKSKQQNDINLSNKVDNTKETLTKETIQKIATKNVAGEISTKTSKKKEDNEPYSLQDFLQSMRESKRRDMHIIAEWAETTKPELATYGQWQSYVKRNVRCAKQLKPFTQEQMSRAFNQIEKESEYGKKFSPTLETLLKYLTR